MFKLVLSFLSGSLFNRSLSRGLCLCLCSFLSSLCSLGLGSLFSFLGSLGGGTLSSLLLSFADNIKLAHG